ncbi:MAG: hypothetical protein FJZ58_02035 [Chlamydiae bacterium]|nr:hypothetical protein [Chlamydiota bacterium]
MSDFIYFSQSSQQRIKLSAYMHQALQVLQMPFLDLQEWLQKQVEENPLLEGAETPSLSFYFQDPPYTPSGFTSLLEQARLTFTNKDQLRIAEWIIEQLDPRGFFQPDQEPPCPPQALEYCMRIIKQWDPPGLAATSLQECLLLQLARKNKQHSISYLVIKEHFEDLLHKKWTILEKSLRLPRKQLLSILQKELCCLRFSPLEVFHKESIPPLFADVTLKEENILVEEPILPRYISYGSITPSLSPEEKAVMYSYQTHAKWVLEAVRQRKATLYKISTYLIGKQSAYLQGVSQALSPLSLQEASEDLSLHPSTLTRALQDKILDCSLGMIPLRSLFSRKITQDTSYDKAQKLLLQLVREEDKKQPLSDQELALKMQSQGFPYSRRTLAKYRQLLNIPARHHRASS